MNAWSERWKSTALLRMLAIVMVATAGICQAQSATVVFRIEMPDKEMKNGLRIRAIQKSPGTRSKSQELRKNDYNYTTHVYTHKIERLPPGAYDFVLCDGRQYKPGKVARTIDAGQVVQVDFLPEDQPAGNTKITSVLPGPEGRPVDAGVPVFLKDIATGCTVAVATTDQGGKYEFAGLPPNTKFEVSIDEADRDP